MNGGKDCEGGAVQVPIGWQRRAELASGGAIVYMSPSGSLLSSLEQVKTYLLTDGTCKCGLECPLVLHKVFNFDPGAAVKQRTAEDVRADEDLTKLCIHKRKLLAVATLHRSMETHPPLGTAAGASSHRAIRTKLQDSSAPPSSSTSSSSSSCSSPFKMMVSSGARQQRLYSPQEVGGAQQPDPYTGYGRPLRDPAPKSPYRLGYSAMLSPPPPSCSSSSSSCSAQSPASPCGFPGVAGSPGSSAPSLLHGGPSRPPPSCALTGRTSTPLSPTGATKSPIMTANPSRGGFHHQAPPCTGPTPLAPPAAPSPCALQKRHVTSEKDPLGILDPIPAKSLPHPHPSGTTPHAPPGLPGFQPPPLLSQVPVMNVNVPPPAVVPLPSNLPLPTVKPAGHAPHLQRAPHPNPHPHPHPHPSPSPSPVTSPPSAAHPRLEASPHRSRSSSTSSDHGGFVPPPPAHPPLKARSPRPALGSPRPALPPSPSQPQLLGQPLYSPTSSSPSPSPTTSSASSSLATPHPGLLGVPLNHILTQQSSASFPASSLLSAAAKAQLANQNKVGGAGGGEGGVSLSGASRGVDGHSALNPMLPPSSALLLGGGEGQSGRAALRDKLMAQQRDPLRRRRQSGTATATANHHHHQQPHDGGGGNLVYGMLGKRGPAPPPHMASPSASEQLRKVGRLGALPPNTSMAQLLQSMSCQSSAHLGPAHRPALGPTHRPQGAPPQLNYDGTSPPQRLRGPADLLQQQHCQAVEPPRPAHYTDMMAPPQGTMSNCSGSGGALRPGANPPPLSHVGPHPSQQQQNHLLHGMARTTSMGAVLSHGGSEGNCGQNLGNSDSAGSASSLGCGLGAQMYQQQQPQLHQAIQQGAPSHLVYQGQQQQLFSENSTYTESSVPANSAPLPCHYQNYQGMMSHPQFLQDGQQQQQQGAGIPAGADHGGGAEAVDAIYRAVVDAASRGVHVTITTTVSGATQAPALSAMSAFTASIGEPAAAPPPPKTAGVTQEAEGLPQQSRPRPLARQGRSHKGLDVGKSTAEGHEVAELFRSPGRRTPRWEAEPLAQGGGTFDGLGGGGSGSWGGEEFLECSTQVRSSPASLAPAPSCPAEVGGEQHLGVAHLEELAYRYGSCGRPPPPPPNYKERLELTVERCAHLNGTAPPPLPFAARGYADVLTGDDQSPSSSTSLEGPLSSAKDYCHYNGHLNGGGGGGMAPSPSDTKSLSSEEELRQPDSPSELLHYRPRAFHMGELVWAPLKGFPPWPATLAGADEHLHAAAMQLREQAKVEPEKLKTLTHDLEALDRAAKRGLKPGKLNNHLEAAIHEAMSELDKMSATIPARERQVKLPKPKRRKISR
ncbi:methyl-CpG-binding domain protein 5 isoform X2 [Nelusetta ayraudi]|uniref:methyl-CpG-binding domain protein 5 isoform X2 n=1 Tax=Nelusetta ayraudi TaxID=303726 RepID=UPI003F70071B